MYHCHTSDVSFTMVYIISVQLTHKHHTTTFITRRRFNMTAALLEARLGLRSGEYKLLVDGGIFGPSLFGKEVVDERDLERTISWQKGLGFVEQQELPGGDAHVIDKKRL